jgi:hypothetical protein
MRKFSSAGVLSALLSQGLFALDQWTDALM